MKKILIISYYGLREALDSAANSLKNYHYEIDTYPLFQYAYDINDKVKNYNEHFDEYVKKSNPDIILWWFINVPTETINYITSRHNAFNILYCWDDPFVWTDPHSLIKEKSKFFDLAAVTCEETLKNYIDNGSKDAIYCPPGYDPKVNFPIKNNVYDCDISICCTNLYEDLNLYSDQDINRKYLIDTLIKEKDIVFNIYGPEFLKYKYPNNYKGFVQYKDLNTIYNKSRINICTHVCKSKSKYINERTILILGSGGLLYVDKPKDLDKLFINGKDCVVIEDDFIPQIKHILKNYDNYTEIKENGKKISYEYTWDKWAEILHRYLGDKFFDEIAYKERYDLKEDDLKKYWNDIGIYEKQIPYKSSHTKRITKKENFDIKKIISECNIDIKCWMEINHHFNEISENINVEENLMSIAKISSNYPYSNINKLLAIYFDTV